MKFKLIDLFSGCGGLTEGFVNPDYCGMFESVFALDNDRAAIASYISNFGEHAVCADIEKLVTGHLEHNIPNADVVIGGPPCQGFSLLNKQRKGDIRRSLWEPFMDVVEISGARTFVIENVTELLKSSEYHSIISKADELGFETEAAVLNAADYGAPQTRRRAFIVGWKRSEVESVRLPPVKTHSFEDSRTDLPTWRTVRDAIGDLGEPKGTEIRDVPPPLNLHFGRSPTELSKKRYRAVPPGGNRFDLQKNAPDITPPCWKRKLSGGTDLFGRLWWDRPSVTIRTEFFKPEKGRYLHPEQHRPITHREAARLMGFRDDFVFTGSKIEIARQIGNAVPPDMAGAVARAVAQVLAAAATKAA